MTATPQHGVTIVPTWIGTRAELDDYAPVLRWLLLMSFVALAFAAFWYFGLLQRMLATDVTHISTLILAVFVLTILHCLYHEHQEVVGQFHKKPWNYMRANCPTFNLSN